MKMFYEKIYEGLRDEKIPLDEIKKIIYLHKSALPNYLYSTSDFLENSVNMCLELEKYIFILSELEVKYMSKELFLHLSVDESVDYVSLYRIISIADDEDYYNSDYFKDILDENILALYHIIIILVKLEEKPHFSRILESLISNYDYLKNYVQNENENKNIELIVNTILRRNFIGILQGIMDSLDVNLTNSNDIDIINYLDTFKNNFLSYTLSNNISLNPDVVVELCKRVDGHPLIRKSFKYKVISSLLHMIKKGYEDFIIDMLKEYKSYFLSDETNLKLLYYVFKNFYIQNITLSDKELFEYIPYFKDINENVFYELTKNRKHFNLEVKDLDKIRLNNEGGVKFSSDFIIKMYKEFPEESLFVFDTELYRFANSNPDINIVDFIIRNSKYCKENRLGMNNIIGYNGYIKHLATSEEYKNNKKEFIFLLKTNNYYKQSIEGDYQEDIINFIIDNDIYINHNKVIDETVNIKEFSEITLISYYLYLIEHLNCNVFGKIRFIMQNKKLSNNSLFKRYILESALKVENK